MVGEGKPDIERESDTGGEGEYAGEQEVILTLNNN